MSDDSYEDRLANLAAYNVAASARRRSAYLAGPDVFRADADAHGAALKALCARHGLEGLWPLDSGADPGDAKAIFAANAAMIRRADLVLANISPFRGPGLDGGTAWEIGFAAALGKPIYAYTDEPRPYAARAAGAADGMAIEDFGLVDNLMIACSVRGPFGSAEEAMAAAQKGGG